MILNLLKIHSQQQKGEVLYKKLPLSWIKEHAEDLKEASFIYNKLPKKLQEEVDNFPDSNKEEYDKDTEQWM